MDIEIRQVSAQDLGALVEAFGYRQHRVESLEQQARGDASYLAAWLNGNLVGQVIIHWQGSSDPLLAEFVAVNQHPYVAALVVNEGQRSQGIGSRIIEQVERLATGRGHEVIGLAVGLENTRAQTFYQRLGYEQVEMPPFRLSYTYVDEDGISRTLAEDCVYVIKHL